MIAASSAAAGAMLLFLFLWHCVFRRVQAQRAHAAGGGGTTVGVGAAAAAAARSSRMRVPKRYLRQMETLQYCKAKRAITRSAEQGVAAEGVPADRCAPQAGLASGASSEQCQALELPVQRHWPSEPPSVQATGGAEIIRNVSLTRNGALGADTALGAAGGAAAVSGAGAVHAQTSETDSLSQAGDECCSICLCEFEDGERIKQLPCK